MISKGTKKNTVRFSIQPATPAQKVELAGDFKDWQPLEMRKRKDGLYVTEVPLAKGSYQYKFIVDGKWQSDPDNSQYVINRFGSANSVAAIS